MNLSKTEKRVLTLIALGYSDKEISFQMKISYGTVRSYIDRLIGKLNARNRTNAAVQYLLLNPTWLEVRE
jgi:DNA-binding NarL/FixJ family response regulator